MVCVSIESLRISAILLESFMPETAVKMLDAINTQQRSFDSVQTFGNLETGIECVKSVEPLFKRIDPKEFAGEDAKEEKKAAKESKKAEKKKKKKEEKPKEPIDIDTFGAISLKAGSGNTGSAYGTHRIIGRRRRN